MIYSITLNPSLDHYMTCDSFEVGKTNRAVKERLLVGGKGINISMMLNQIGIRNRSIGFVAGFTGEEILKRLEEAGIEHDFIRTDSGFSRINVKLMNGDLTEINGIGPMIGTNEINALFDKIDHVTENDAVIVSGNIPASIDIETYESLLGRINERKARLVVDTSGEKLKKSLEQKPFLIKPNLVELEELFQCKISSLEEAACCALKAQSAGALNVIVSLGPQGAILLDENKCCFHAKSPEIAVRNSVGAGDVLLASFLGEYIGTNVYPEAFTYAVSAATLHARDDTYPTDEEIREYEKQLQIKEMTL
ncbi:MAG: 1-phosphofructokinase [Erysipelotrichaceae bacterium]|nr:1-phosphofructokinase [Erysipelotrichaceae bacterium]